jgi:hypothetical protein
MIVIGDKLMSTLLRAFSANLFRVTAMLCYTTLAGATSIVLSGTITQSPADSGVPAVNNPSLNNIADGDAYTVTLSFTNSITMPGAYMLDSALFTDMVASASESAFTSVSLTITQSGATDQFSVLGCLANCAVGNQLALEFAVPAADLNAASPAAPIPALLPMDLLEDDGNTDIHGTISSYSYQGTAANAPEPATFALVGLSLIAIGAVRRRRAPR